jgi:A/G-specific adenine glycosylase
VTVQVQEVAVVVRCQGRVFLVQRPAGGRWEGLWEFPHGPLQEGETHEHAANRLLRELTSLRARRGPELLTIRHGVTRFQITMVCFEAEYRAGTFRSSFYRQGVWVAPEELASYPVSSPQRRLARALTAPDRQRRLF